MAEPSLFDRFGFEGATRIALGLYDGVMESDRLERHFRDVDLERLVEHQALFIAFIMGGPASYSDAELKLVHGPLGIDQAAFDEMLDVLRGVLQVEGLVDEDITEVMTQFTSRRPSIVSGRKDSGNRVA